MEENIKLKGGKRYKARFCKMELKDGTSIYAKRVEYRDDSPHYGDYLPEEKYYYEPLKKEKGSLSNLWVWRDDVVRMSIAN